jgi:hypothetical protein
MGQVSHIIWRQGFATEMGVDVAQTAQPIRGGAEPAKIGKENAAVVANHDVFDRTLAVDEHTDLPARFLRQLTEVPRQFSGNDLLCWYPTTVDMLNALYLIRLQTCNIAVYTLNRLSSSPYITSVPTAAGTPATPAARHAPNTIRNRGDEKIRREYRDSEATAQNNTGTAMSLA